MQVLNINMVNDTKTLPLLSHMQLFSGTTQEEIAAMLHCLTPTIKKYAKGETIWRTGDMVTSLGVVLKGTVHVVQEDFWGNHNIIASIAQGMSFGEAFACASVEKITSSVIAQSDCEIMFLDARRVLTTCSSNCSHHNRIIRNLVSDLANKNLHSNEKMKLLSQRSTRAKLLAYLSSEAMRTGSASFIVPFSRQQLADYLSVERSGLSSELSKLQKEGLLEIERNKFTLKQ